MSDVYSSGYWTRDSYDSNGILVDMKSGVPDNFPTANLSIAYTDFKKVKSIVESYKKYYLTYGVDGERRKSVIVHGTTTKLTHYYLGDYEEEVFPNGTVRKIHYLSGGAILISTNGQDSLLYGYTDYQGSLIALTDENNVVLQRYAYDPWGNRRNPDNWAQKDSRTAFLLNRGYTGHEHLDAFGVINMNGRVYDPFTAQFLSPDPFVQAPEDWLNYNRYAYCLNNPMRYTDPSGNLILEILATIWLLTSDEGYEVQKFFLPVAVHYDIHLGSDRKSLGFEMSVGKPQIWEGNRYEAGISYYWDDYGDDGVTSTNSYEGWELSYGKEHTTGWHKGTYFKTSHTHYEREGTKFDQDWDKLTIGVIPGLWYTEFGNDCNLHDVFETSSMPEHSSSDKMKTAEVKFHFFGFQAGLILYTGDSRNEKGYYDDVTRTYIKNGDIDPDEYRAGIAYIGWGPLRFGVNNEKIRSWTQNLVHKWTGDPKFKVLEDNWVWRPYWEITW